MRTSDSLTPENFEALLLLFSEDRDEAGKKYEQIRLGLVRFFDFNGCIDPDNLADETINRVAAKTDAYDPERTKRFAAYFYGFAAKVLLEYRREIKREIPLAENREYAPGEMSVVPEEMHDRCLERCLEKLPPVEREMISDYYAFEGEKKQEIRLGLCRRLGLSPGTLHTKIFRIKTTLRACIENCLKTS